MSNTVDSAVLTLLRAVPNLNVYDGYVTDSDENEKTVSAPLPYVVFYATSAAPETESRSMAGAAGAQTEEFQLSGVGSDRNQAKWALEKARQAVENVRLASVARTPVVRRSDDQFMVRRDDTWTRPDGKPLFFGADRYLLTF